MAAVANAEWGRLTTARRCEPCDRRASRKIFLRDRGNTYIERGRLVGPVARRSRKRPPIERTPDTEHNVLKNKTCLRTIAS
jgi:hypothetical protein